MKNICTRCGHEWIPRISTVHAKSCPGCKSPYWDTPRREKVFFDPKIHSQDRERLIEYVDVTHGGNMTAAAYHLGVEYPFLSGLIKKWKIIPAWLIERLESQQPERALKRLTPKAVKRSVQIEDEIKIPAAHLRNTYNDWQTPISPDQHRDQCIKLRKHIENNYERDISKFAKKHEFKVVDIKNMYTGEDKIHPLIAKELGLVPQSVV